MAGDKAPDNWGFQKTLVEDVQQALDRATASDRRNLLRTIISAVEGISWTYREHILSIAKSMDAATPLIERAYSETVIFVSEQGEVAEQPRYISTTAMIGLTTKFAQTFCVQLDVDFGHAGWGKLRRAITMRNRITHPKSDSDLIVTSEDIDSATIGFFWFLALVEHVRRQTVAEFSNYVEKGREVLDRLKAGDPEIMALYTAQRDLPD